MTIPNIGTYFPDPIDTRYFGMDISSNQGFVDFDKVKQHEYFPEPKFMVARTGISWAYVDSWFDTYWKFFKEKLNVVRLAYHVMYPLEDKKAQVDNMKKHFPGGVFDGDAVVNDVELVHGATRSQMSQATYEMNNRLQDWAKKPVFTYSRFGFIYEYFDLTNTFYFDWYKKQLWWMAQYYGKDLLGKPILKEFPTSKLWYPKEYMKEWKVYFHQTGEKGDGVRIGTTSKQVDTDRWCRSVAEFNNLFNVSEIIPEPEPIPGEPIDISAELHAIEKAVFDIRAKME